MGRPTGLAAGDGDVFTLVSCDDPDSGDIHPLAAGKARPGLCGDAVGPEGDVQFSHMEPHPATAGAYGCAGTVAGYVARQGVEPFVEAADRYLALLKQLYQAWHNSPDIQDLDDSPRGQPSGAMPDLLDPAAPTLTGGQRPKVVFTHSQGA